jgi:hypothetical protein
MPWRSNSGSGPSAPTIWSACTWGHCRSRRHSSSFSLTAWCAPPPPLPSLLLPLPLSLLYTHSLSPSQVAQGALLFARVAERLEQDGQEGKRVSLEPLRGAGSGGGSLQQTLLLAAQAIFRAARRL